MAGVRTLPAQAGGVLMRDGHVVVRPDGAGRAAQRMPFFALVVFIALLIPAFFHLGTLLMTPSRLLFLLLIPLLLLKLLGKQYGRVTYIDWMILFHMSWFTLSVFVNASAGVAVTYTGVNTVILLGGYLAGRAAIRDLDQFLGFVRFFAFVLTLSLPFILYETLTGHLTIPKLIEMIPGLTSNKDVQYPRRMGLDRVQFVFVQTIHFGYFCSLSVGLFFVAMKQQMGSFRLWAQTAVLALATFFSLSSGPFLSMVIQFLLIMWLYVMRNLQRPWMTLAWLCLGLYVVLEVASNGPALYVIITKLAFNSGTANARRVLLDYGIDQVIATPVFGIFKRPWNLPPWMTGSLDNYWLGLAVAFGFPTFFSQFAAFILAIVAIAKRDFPKGSTLDRVRTAWVISMISATLTLGTVFVWSEIASFMFFFFAAGLWMMD
uniref:hypothetical protein n=1 Tax=Albidovulum sp. TaxID=1872424 RepID=UPI0039B86C4E